MIIGFINESQVENNFFKLKLYGEFLVQAIKIDKTLTEQVAIAIKVITQRIKLLDKRVTVGDLKKRLELFPDYLPLVKSGINGLNDISLPKETYVSFDYTNQAMDRHKLDDKGDKAIII